MYGEEKTPAAAAVVSSERGTVKVYQRILELLEAEGINAVFGIPDPNFVHLFVEAEKRGWTVVTPHHELSAGFMAEGYARKTGRPALCIATLGPGIALTRSEVRRGGHECVRTCSIRGSPHHSTNKKNTNIH